MTGFEPATSFDTGPQLPAPLTTWNTCVGFTGRMSFFHIDATIKSSLSFLVGWPGAGALSTELRPQ